jgi:hypothetical protein
MLSGSAALDASHAGNRGSNLVGVTGPEISDGLGAFLCAARATPGFYPASCVCLGKTRQAPTFVP